MDKVELKVDKRKTLGKDVRFLRRQGITPVHLFGHGIESLSLQCGTAELKRILAQAGHTRLISLKVDEGKKPMNVLVREVQKVSLTGELLHVDFYNVKMAEKIKMEVPVVLVGEAPALKLKENMLVQDFHGLTVECLPAKIPASIELDISSLTEADQAIRVRDITLGDEVALLNDPELMVVKISLRHVEVIEEVVAAEGLVEEAEAEAAAGAPEAAPPAEEGAKGE
ncbi:MAG: 50S ribosomal protein L25 [Chloroflexota bacterium]